MSIRLKIYGGREVDGGPLADRVINCISLDMLVEDTGLEVNYDAEYTGGFTIVPFKSKEFFKFDSELEEEE